ncbi:TPA: replication protein P [Escherichia coli]
MKNMGEQLQNYDRQQFARVARGLPEQRCDRPGEQTALVFNELFRQLRATFPAAMANLKTQDDLNDFRRTWVLAFHENGINTLEQVAAGMRVARSSDKPFLPSPGQFISWCRESGGVLGINAADVMTEYWNWRKLVFRYPTSEQYPWTQPVMYHICVELRRRGTEGRMTESELTAQAGKLLVDWEKRVMDGKPIPPVRRALAAPCAPRGKTPAQELLEKYNARKSAGLI